MCVWCVCVCVCVGVGVWVCMGVCMCCVHDYVHACLSALVSQGRGTTTSFWGAEGAPILFCFRF